MRLWTWCELQKCVQCAGTYTEQIKVIDYIKGLHSLFMHWHIQLYLLALQTVEKVFFQTFFQS